MALQHFQELTFGTNPSTASWSTTNSERYNNSAYLTNDSLNSLYSSISSDAQAIWDREDSAYQRMVADMQKAGLNPWTGISTGGSQTSSTNPSESAFNGLITGLEYNLKSREVDRKDMRTIFDGLIELFKASIGAGKSITSSALYS